MVVVPDQVVVVDVVQLHPHRRVGWREGILVGDEGVAAIDLLADDLPGVVARVVARDGGVQTIVVFGVGIDVDLGELLIAIVVDVIKVTRGWFRLTAKGEAGGADGVGGDDVRAGDGG